MSDSADPYIYLDGNDKEEIFDLTRPNTSTGEDEAAAGLTGLTVHYSLTKAGAAIHADVTETLAEYASTAGRYHATMEGDSITARLSALENPRIQAVVKDSGGNVKCSFDRFVVAARTG